MAKFQAWHVSLNWRIKCFFSEFYLQRTAGDLIINFSSFYRRKFVWTEGWSLKFEGWCLIYSAFVNHLIRNLDFHEKTVHNSYSNSSYYKILFKCTWSLTPTTINQYNISLNDVFGYWKRRLVQKILQEIWMKSKLTQWLGDYGSTKRMYVFVENLEKVRRGQGWPFCTSYKKQTRYFFLKASGNYFHIFYQKKALKKLW